MLLTQAKSRLGKVKEARLAGQESSRLCQTTLGCVRIGFNFVKKKRLESFLHGQENVFHFVSLQMLSAAPFRCLYTLWQND